MIVCYNVYVNDSLLYNGILPYRCACVECAVPKDCEENGGELVVPPGMCCPICMLAMYVT